MHRAINKITNTPGWQIKGMVVEVGTWYDNRRKIAKIRLRHSEDYLMTIQTGSIHHMALTVSDPVSSSKFYMSVLGFNHLMDVGPVVLLGNGSVVLGLIPKRDGAQAIPNDRFSEARIGLDHVSFGVASLAALEAAVKLFDERGILHG